MKRYFIDCDYDANSVLIPVKKRKKWGKWLAKNEHVFEAELPKWAKKIKDYTYVEFSNYKITK